jgi:LuxR family maltose regulon positive regulatory protein
LNLYRGDVLPEDGPAEWVVSVRDLYRVRAGDVAGDLAELRLELGQHAEAVAAARRSIDLAPWRDASWRTLQLACRAAGDLASAERARADYRTMLAGLGVTPERAQVAVSCPPR